MGGRGKTGYGIWSVTGRIGAAPVLVLDSERNSSIACIITYNIRGGTVS